MFPDLSSYAIVATILVMAIPMPLLGEELKLIPGLALKEEYNDNIFLASGARHADFITTLSPSLDISSATERRTTTLSTGINWLDYARTANLDSLDYFGQGGFGYRIGPRLTLSAGAGYVRNSRPDRTDLNGLTLKSGSGRQNYQLSGNYAVSEKSTASISYAYSREVFDNSATALSTTVHTASLSQDYNLDRYLRQTKLVGSLGFTRSLTDISQVSDYTATLGFTKKVHELWGFSLNAGGRYTRSEFETQVSSVQPVASTISNTSQGWVGNFSVNYSDETLNSSLTFNHDISTAAGRTGATERTGVSANLSQRFTREFSGNMGMGYSWNKSEQNQFSAQNIDERNLNITCGLRYNFTDDVALESNYRYNDIDNKQSATRTHQNIILMNLTMRRDVLDR